MENNPPPSMAGVEGFPHDAALTGSRYAEIAGGEPRQLAQSFIIPARKRANRVQLLIVILSILSAPSLKSSAWFSRLQRS